MSSDRNVSVPVEASIEDLHGIPYEPPVESSDSHLQTDAKVISSPSPVEEKLEREFQYHKYGSYNCKNLDPTNGYYQNNNFHFNTSDNTVRQPEQDRPPYASSVHSWTKAEPVQPTSQEEPGFPPNAGFHEYVTPSIPTSSYLPMSVSTPSLSHFNQQHPYSHCGRQQSWPAYPVSDTAAAEITPRHLLTSSKSGSLQDPGTYNHVCLMKHLMKSF